VFTNVVEQDRSKEEEIMNAKIFLTISAVIAILFGLAFVLFPTATGAVYGVPSDPHTSLIAQFFGSALILVGVVNWFAKDFRDWDAVRGVLIANVIGDVVGGGVNLLGTFQGLLNNMAWSSTLIYVLLLAGALYCLSAGPEASGLTAKPAR
jgi:hypothetical protein